LLKYGETKTNVVYTKGIWRKYVSPAPGYKLVTTSSNADGYDTLEEALDAKCQADWKCLGFDFSFKVSKGRFTIKSKLLYPGSKSPEDDWRFKYEHFYGVTDT
jgi:hypothetical protein